jgi:hypothetical protein
MTIQELLDQEDDNQTFASFDAARLAIASMKSLLPAHRTDLISMIVRMPSEVPLMHTVDGTKRINSAEFTRRMMRALDSAAEAVRVTSQKPHKHADKGGWKPVKQPTPGRASGAQKERG